jgi:hypothetical protein
MRSAYTAVISDSPILEARSSSSVQTRTSLDDSFITLLSSAVHLCPLCPVLLVQPSSIVQIFPYLSIHFNRVISSSVTSSSPNQLYLCRIVPSIYQTFASLIRTTGKLNHMNCATYELSAHWPVIYLTPRYSLAILHFKSFPAADLPILSLS